MHISLTPSDWSFRDVLAGEPSGEIPAPFFQQNEGIIESIQANIRICTKTFWVDEALRGRRVRLCFDRVTAPARFYLNGEQLGSYEGGFDPVFYEVDQVLKYGEENQLRVLIEPGTAAPSQEGRICDEASEGCQYWGERTIPDGIHQGLREGVYLEVTGLARIENLWVRPLLRDDLQQARVAIHMDLSARWPAFQPSNFPSTASRSFKAYPLEVEVEIELRCQGLEVGRQQTTCDISYNGGRLLVSLPVSEPRLWWPAGLGEPVLYEAVVRVWDPRLSDMPEMEESDCRTVSFGFRRLELISREGASEQPSLHVNGLRVHVQGQNWKPMDGLGGEENPKKLEGLLLTWRARTNLLFLGGGWIEQKTFYVLCDRLGLLVGQKLFEPGGGPDQSGNAPDLIRSFLKDAEQIVLRLRNHPCLALWGGNDGLQNRDEGTSLRETVQRLDPDRPWLPGDSSLG